RNRLSTVDLITLDTLEIAKRAHVPPADIRRFSTHVIEALHGDLGFEKKHAEPVGTDPNLSFDGPVEIELGARTALDLDSDDWNVISTLDDGIDAILGGGLPKGYLCEVTGESGSGKTQFLLTLLLSIQLPHPKGLQQRAIYISTEAPLSTPRLSQILESNPYLSNLSSSNKPNLTNILSINAMDLETQDHILNYQLPVAVKRYNVGLVIIDSITANYRAEHTASTMAALSARSGELARLGQMLRNLAVSENVAVVVANQVSDRVSEAVDFPLNSLRVQRDSGASSPAPKNLSGVGGDSAIPSSSPAIPSSPFVDDGQVIEGVADPARNEILSLLHQQRFFTGWGDTRAARPELSYGVGYQKPALKTPTLGLVWSSQIACRIALKKEESLPDLHVDSGYEMSSGRLSIGNSQVSKEAPEEADKKDPSRHDKPTDKTTPVDQSVPTSQQYPVPEDAGKITRRTLKLVMAPWTAGELTEDGNIKDEVDFKIWKGGLSSIHD
ncbi:DNA repair protein RAD57, partial [Aspergillus sclerotialis]